MGAFPVQVPVLAGLMPCWTDVESGEDLFPLSLDELDS